MNDFVTRECFITGKRCRYQVTVQVEYKKYLTSTERGRKEDICIEWYQIENIVCVDHIREISVEVAKKWSRLWESLRTKIEEQL